MRVLQCRRGTKVVKFLYSVLTYNATQQCTMAVLHNSFAVILFITIIIIFFCLNNLDSPKINEYNIDWPNPFLNCHSLK